jgi:uncharacterized protein YcbK (DUF882 family)
MTESSQPGSFRYRFGLGITAFLVIVGVAWGLAAFQDFLTSASPNAPTDLPPIPEMRPLAERVEVPDTMLGASGALRFRTLTGAEAIEVPGFIAVLGERAIRTPAVHQTTTTAGEPFAYVVLRPFGEKQGERLHGYRLGRWPAERWIISRNYFNPDGFVEVMPATAGLKLSAHFTLGDFLTHDQRDVWPKYVVLEEKLIDKLELVLQQLDRQGIPTARVTVLSGFRAPYYNERGVGEGMARTSRHQYGDAADIIIDADGNGQMDDLNRDGKIDLRDPHVISQAIAAVERAHPLLVGGLGTYTAMGPRGPFAHVDVRGTSARWENRGTGRLAPTGARPGSPVPDRR